MTSLLLEEEVGHGQAEENYSGHRQCYVRSIHRGRQRWHRSRNGAGHVYWRHVLHMSRTKVIAWNWHDGELALPIEGQIAHRYRLSGQPEGPLTDLSDEYLINGV